MTSLFTVNVDHGIAHKAVGCKVRKAGVPILEVNFELMPDVESPREIVFHASITTIPRARGMEEGSVSEDADSIAHAFAGARTLYDSATKRPETAPRFPPIAPEEWEEIRAGISKEGGFTFPTKTKYGG